MKRLRTRSPYKSDIQIAVDMIGDENATVLLGQGDYQTAKQVADQATKYMNEAADMLTALSQPDPTGGWCSDMEAAPRDQQILLYIPGRKEPMQTGFWIWKHDDNDDPSIGVWWSADGREDAQPTAWQRITPPVRGQEKGGA